MKDNSGAIEREELGQVDIEGGVLGGDGWKGGEEGWKRGFSGLYLLTQPGQLLQCMGQSKSEDEVSGCCELQRVLTSLFRWIDCSILWTRTGAVCTASTSDGSA